MHREEYFRFLPDKRIANIVIPQDLPKEYTYSLKKEAFDSVDDLLPIHYDDKEVYQFPDWIFRPVLMFSGRMKDVFDELMPAIKCHGLQYLLASDAIMTKDPLATDLPRPLYWVPYFPPQDVLHSSTRINSLGKAENLGLSGDALAALTPGNRSFVRVSLAGEEIYLVSYSMVERLLSMRAWGMRFEAVPIL